MHVYHWSLQGPNSSACWACQDSLWHMHEQSSCTHGFSMSSHATVLLSAKAAHAQTSVVTFAPESAVLRSCILLCMGLTHCLALAGLQACSAMQMRCMRELHTHVKTHNRCLTCCRGSSRQGPTHCTTALSVGK